MCSTLYILTNIAAHKHKKCWMMLKMNFMENYQSLFSMGWQVAKQVQQIVEFNNVGWHVCWSNILVFKKVLCCLLFTYFLTSLINRNWVKIWQENESTQRRTGAEKENWNSWNWRGLLSINTINSNNDNNKNYYY